MFPKINVFGFFEIYTFGITVTICFFLFAWMLKRLSKRFNFSFSIFTDNLLWFFIFTFLFSRLFYILSRWDDLKYIKDNFIQFFILSEYNFSLIGGVLGFLFVLSIIVKVKKENINKYMYGVVLSFLFVLPLGYIGALFGGQVYGENTNFGIEITYSNSLSPVPYKSPVFPLPIVYSIVFFISFSVFYMLNMYVKHKALLGYLAIITFSTFIFSLEFFSGKPCLIKDTVGLNLNQISSIFLIIFAVYRVYKIYTKNIEL